MENDLAERGATAAHASVRYGTRGFTLLEVVVAIAIAALALVALFRAGSAGLFSADTAVRVAEAVERAQSHLSAFGQAVALKPGELEGDDGDGYHWKIVARPIAMQPPPQPEQAGVATALYDVTVVVSWPDSGRSHSVILNTLRIGGAAAQ